MILEYCISNPTIKPFIYIFYSTPKIMQTRATVCELQCDWQNHVCNLDDIDREDGQKTYFQTYYITRLFGIL